MTWVNSGGAVSGGGVTTSPYASEAEVQALKTDGAAGGSVLVTATGAGQARTLADHLATLPDATYRDAAAATKGVLQLANDLGGTAAAPQVTATHLAAPLPQAQGGTGATSVGAATITATGTSTTKTAADWMLPLATTGTPDATTFLRGDRMWAVPSGGASVFDVVMPAATGVAATDRANLAAALTAGAGKRIGFPSGVYDFTGAAVSVPDGTILEAAGSEADPTRSGTVFMSSSTDFSFFTCANRCVFKGINFDKGVQTITSGSVIKITGIAVRVHDVYMNAAYGGIVVKPSASSQSGGHHFRGLGIKNVVSGGVALDFDGSAASGNVDACTITDFVLSGSIDATTTATMIYLRGHAEGLVFANGIMVGGGYSVQTSSRSWAMSERPAHNNFTNVHFDASRLGVVLTDTFNLGFVNCWFSTGMAGYGSGSASSHGCLVNQSDFTTFTGCVFGNSYAYGLAAGATAKHLRIVNSSALGNNGGAVGAHGFSISAGQTDFVIQGCTATNVPGFAGSQGWGIVINGGASDRYIVADNLVSGNATGGVSDGGTGVNKRVANNY